MGFLKVYDWFPQGLGWISSRIRMGVLHILIGFYPGLG